MLDRNLKRVIAAVSLVTLIIIILFAMLAVLLMTNHDIATQPAYAWGGEATQVPTQPPTPTPTPYWTPLPQRSGAAIILNGTTVTATVNVPFHANYSWADYGFEASASDDKDTYYSWNGSQMSPQESVDDVWTTNGLFLTAVPSTPTSVTLTADWQDNNSPSNTKDNQLSASADVNIVGVAKIEVEENGSWVDRTGQTISVLVGTTIPLRAVIVPANASWPAGCPQWGGEASGKTGEEIEVTFNSLGPKQVSAGPYTQTVNVNVVDPNVTIETIKGLYDSSGAYTVGYTSDDNLGRIYSNRTYSANDPTTSVWNKNKQYVDFSVRVTTETTLVLPAGARIVWEAQDPDDPSDDGMTTQSAVAIDPNDYDSADSDNDGFDKDGSDNTGTTDGASEWEEISGYALSNGNETEIVNGVSKVRFNVTDDGGDNFIVKIKFKYDDTQTTPQLKCQTGIMTVWEKINIEYVKMETADSLPVNSIPSIFSKAYVEFNIALSRTVSDGIVDNGTSTTHQWVMGLVEGSAEPACYNYCKASGEFSHEGPGWFFVASAHEFIPYSGASEILYPSSGTAGNAIANGHTITLSTAIDVGKVPNIVWIYNSALTSRVLFEVKNGTLSADRKTFEIKKKDYHEVNYPDTSFLDADLTDYGFSPGSTIYVQVKSPGAYRIDGISPGLAGKTIIFTDVTPGVNSLGALVHEFTHAFGLAHLCGNWDCENATPSASCAMNYGSWFILNDSAPRVPIQWTNDQTGTNLCACHLKAIRKCKLENLAQLGW